MIVKRRFTLAQLAIASVLILGVSACGNTSANRISPSGESPRVITAPEQTGSSVVMQARLEGTLVAKDGCVVADDSVNAQTVLLVFPAGTQVNESSVSLKDGGSLRFGDSVSFSGGFVKADKYKTGLQGCTADLIFEVNAVA